MVQPDLVEARDILAVTQMDLSLHHGVETGASAFERRFQLLGDDEVGFELDRPLSPERARVAHDRIERPFILLARFACLSEDEPEIACAERRAVARHRRYLVAR